MCLCFCNIWLYLAPTPTLYIYYLNLYLAPMIYVKIFVLYLCALVCIHISPTTQYSLNVPKIWIPMFVSITEPPSTTPKTFHVLCTYLQQYHHHYHRIHPKIDERSRCLRLNGKFYCHCKKNFLEICSEQIWAPERVRNVFEPTVRENVRFRILNIESNV